MCNKASDEYELNSLLSGEDDEAEEEQGEDELEEGDEEVLEGGEEVSYTSRKITTSLLQFLHLPPSMLAAAFVLFQFSFLELLYLSLSLCVSVCVRVPVSLDFSITRAVYAHGGTPSRCRFNYLS